MPKGNINVIIATRNPGKVLEFSRLLAGLPINWRSLDDAGIAADLAEDGDTFEANARQKAETAAHLSGGWALADDSGLCVAALNGRPGVYSKRYAGPGSSDPQKWARLLNELAGVPDEQRLAWFECALALAHPAHATLVTVGRVDGQIGHAPKGENGFGYDPLFFMQERGQTMAELSSAEKDQISHRGRAVQALRPHLVRLFGAEGLPLD